MAESRNQIHTHDGRLGEEVIREENGVKTREILVEPKVEKRLSKRIIETSEPAIRKRVTEIFDEETGQVIEQLVESVDDVELKLVSHVAVEPEVHHATTHTATAKDCDCVSHEEFKSGLEAAVKAAVSAVMENQPAQVHETHVAAAPRLNMQAMVASKINEQEDSQSIVKMVMIGVIGLQVLAVGFLVWHRFML